MLNIKNERGYVTYFVIALMLFIMVFAGVFINVIMNYNNINFAKKSMQEATRVRALTTDVYMKERYGMIETVYPVASIEKTEEDKSIYEKTNLDTETKKLRNSIIKDPLTGKDIPTRFSAEYKASVKYANQSAKSAMISSVNAFVGNRVVGSDENKKMFDVYEKNICFDVKPIQKETSIVTFSCNVEDNDGVRHRIVAEIEVSGYEDLNKKNKVILKNIEKEETQAIVTNVVFGAAVVTPKLFMPSAISKFTFTGEENQFIYSVAYPQIDICYSQNEC